MIPDALHRFCRDAFLLARYGRPEEGRPDGRVWEHAVTRGMWMPEISRRQHAGTLGLFGCTGRSGANPELDGAGHGPGLGIWVEAKARAELDKSDVAVFAFKVLDLYRESAACDPEGTMRGAWWPVFVSSEPCGEAVHRCCLGMGVILCEPSVFPLPTLVRVAARPSADMHLDERLLGMAVDLGERLCRPMQARWPLDPARRQLCLSLDEPGATAIGDALFVQRELTGDLLDFYDSHAPGELERRGLRAAERLGPAALTMRW
jgi:hypothetical protein